MAIDTLAYAKTLEAAGVDRRAAEAHAEALTQALEGRILPDLATKSDLERLDAALKTDLERLDATLKTDLERLQADLKTDLQRVQADLKHEFRSALHEQTLRLIGFTFMVVGIVDAILFALLRFGR